ncbi:MAG: hypothetical protein ACRDTG_29225 [Pseudonocardiaceae bacterium]
MGDNACELGKTLAALRRMGRLEAMDSARLQMLRSMARALDANPQNAALWKQYRESLKDLLADDSAGSLGDELAALFTPVRDSPPP